MPTFTPVQSTIKTRTVKADRPRRPDITRQYRRIIAVTTEIDGRRAQASIYANRDNAGPVYLTLHWHTPISSGQHLRYTDRTIKAYIATLKQS